MNFAEDPDMESPTTAIADYLRKSISVSYILDQIWTGRWLVASGLLIGIAFGMYAVWTKSPNYIATIRVSPAESDLSGNGGGSGAGSILADLTGGMNSQFLPKFTQFTLSVSSPNVAQMLNQRYDMLCRTYRNDCDPATHRWRERTGWRESMNAFLAWLGHLPDPNGPRTIIDLSQYIADSVNVNQNKQNAVATLTFTHPDAKFAADFLSKVVKTTNDYIKLQNRDIQRRYVENLTLSAGKTTNVEQRQAIDTLLLQEERQYMLTEVDVPYAAQIMDGPTVVPVDIARRTLVIYALIGTLVGAGVAACRGLLPHRRLLW